MVFIRVGNRLTNLLPFLEEASNHFDVSNAHDIVHLDLQKAFDKVTHDKLIIRMRMVGIIEAISEQLRLQSTKSSSRRDLISAVYYGSGVE